MRQRAYKKVTGYEKGIKVKGITEVTKNLEKYFNEYGVGCKESLIKITTMLYSDMDNNNPKIPVDTGHLRSSWFVKIVKASKTTYGAIFGFKANYALYVHEMVNADFTSARWRYGPGPGRKRWYVPRPGAGPKFMEAHMKRDRWKFMKILLDEMRQRTKKANSKVKK